MGFALGNTGAGTGGATCEKTGNVRERAGGASRGAGGCGPESVIGSSEGVAAVCGTRPMLAKCWFRTAIVIAVITLKDCGVREGWEFSWKTRGETCLRCRLSRSVSLGESGPVSLSLVSSAITRLAFSCSLVGSSQWRG